MPQNSNANAGPAKRQARGGNQRAGDAFPEVEQDFLPQDRPEAGADRAPPQSLAEVTDDVSGVATAAKDQLTEAASTLGDTAREAARATFKAVSDQASALTSDIASEMTTVAETEKSRGADAILGFAKAIERASSELDGQSPQIARAFRSAADSVESFSDSLRGERVGDLVAAASDYAKRQPLAFFAGALVAGFAASRFLLSHEPTASDSGRAAEGADGGFPDEAQAVAK
jgi:hypothetical protein